MTRLVFLAVCLGVLGGCEQKEQGPTIDTDCHYGGKTWPSRLAADGVRECWIKDMPK